MELEYKFIRYEIEELLRPGLYRLTAFGSVNGYKFANIMGISESLKNDETALRKFAEHENMVMALEAWRNNPPQWQTRP